MAHADSAATTLNTESSWSWTFPAGLTLLVATIICLCAFVLYPRSSPPPCELQLRLMLTFGVPAAAGGLLLPLALDIRSGLVRGALAAIGAVVAGGIAWFAIASLFPSFC